MNFFQQVRYPGRFIILGQDGNNFVTIYGATGRSQSSLNRNFLQQANEVRMVQTSEGGNPELLTYPALKISGNNIVVANGRQIEKLNSFNLKTAQELLIKDLAKEDHEPDDNKTPRITGCFLEKESKFTAGLHIIRSIGDVSERTAWAIPLVSGQGMYISTYNGDDTTLAPSFMGKPISLEIDFGSPEIAAQSIFELLAPPSGMADYRVGIIACYKKIGEIPKLAIVNRHRN